MTAQHRGKLQRAGIGQHHDAISPANGDLPESLRQI